VSILGLFNIGLSGLETADQLLQVTGNNVANSQTPDYDVETASLSTVPTGAVSSTGETGNGVQVADITRSYNSFINAQVNTENANVSYWNNYNTAISQVQDIFNEASSAGISPAITTFYSDWQNIAENPQDDAQRTTLISDATSLSNSLNTAAASLDSVSGQLLTGSQTLVTQANTYTAQIATLNTELAGNPGSLDLQDQRDALVSKLNGIVKVSTFQDSGTGMLSVMVGGVPLVEGTASYNMSVETDSSNNMQFYVDLAPNAATAPTEGSAEMPAVTSFITGGQLASNLDLRNTEIPGYMNQLNAFAVDLADTTNYYQKQGYGLDGSTGTNFFQPLSTQAKYTSVESSGAFTSPNDSFSTTGGTLSIKLGDNDASPATVTVGAGATLQDVVNDINNSQAGSKVTASVVNLGPISQFDISAANGNNVITTNLGSYTIPNGTYTAVGLAAQISGQAGVNVAYNSAANSFTITPTAVGGASDVVFTPAAQLLGLTATQIIGTGITASPQDYRISIQSNPAGNLGNVRIGVTTADAAGSGLNLLATSPLLSNNTPGAAGAVISSVNVTDPTQTVPNSTLLATAAQYKIDYNYSGGAGYQEDGATGIYWRVMESTDGSTWTAISPNTSYNPSEPSSLNEAEVNLTSDSAGLTRTLEFLGVKVQIDGSGINSTTNPNGGTFNVQFDAQAAKDIKAAITDPNQVAASSDTWNITSSNNSVVFNVNGGPNITAVIPSGTYTNDPGQSDDISAALTSAIQTAYQTATGSALPDTLSAVFNPNTKQFNITMTSGNDTINLLWKSDPVSQANQVFGFSGDSDTPVSFVTGTSAVSDNPASVETSATQGLPGDNTNAQTIFNQSNGNMFAGTTPTDMYMSMVSNIGVGASSANTNLQYHTTLASELTQQQQQISGVSMDEEASNLVVYQKSYEAAAQLITTANQMLTTLLQMVNPNA